MEFTCHKVFCKFILQLLNRMEGVEESLWAIKWVVFFLLCEKLLSACELVKHVLQQRFFQEYNSNTEI